MLDLEGATIGGPIKLSQASSLSILAKSSSDKLFRPLLENAFPKIDLDKNALKRTIILGQIRLTNATINGDVSFNRTIFNIPGEHKPQNQPPPANPKPTIEMRNAIIDGSVDFQESAGVRSIDGLNAHIKGDIRFYTDPKYDQQREDYQKVTHRATLWSDAIKEQEQGNIDPENPPTINLIGTTIEGSVSLLFHHDHFPSLKLAYAQIAGKLMILPENGWVQHEPEDPDSDPDPDPDADTDADTDSRLQKISSIFLPSLFKIFSDKRVSNTITDKIQPSRNWAKNQIPTIDLHGLEVPVFVHHPRAWPKQDGLVVSGMRYNATEALGHLYPKPVFWGDVHKNLNRNVRIGADIVALIVITIILPLIVGLFYGVNVNGFDGIFFDMWEGARNIWCTQIYPSLDFYALILLLIASLASLVFGRLFHPNNARAKSMAVRWLKLQRRHFGTRKVYKDVRPTEAYLRAAIVLRTAGRMTSANEVEIARIGERMQGVSWRKNPLAQGLFKLFYWVIEYGYKPSRAVLFSLAIILLASIAIRCQAGFFILKDGSSPGAPVPSFFYALDVFVPFLNLGVADTWTPAYPTKKIGWHIFCGIIGLRILGWVAITLIAMSVATRLETVWAKSRIV